MTEWLGPIPAGNYGKGRAGRRVDFLVMHHMDGTLGGTDAWFHNAASGVSSTFGVGPTRVVQWVGVDDTPYANGILVANYMAETLEWEDQGQDDPTSDPRYVFTDAQYALGAALVRERALARGIPIRRGVWPHTPGIIGHGEIIGTFCPGTLDLNRIVKEAQTVTPEQEAKLNRLLEIAERLLIEATANEDLVWAARLQRSLDVERGAPFDENVPPIDARVRP